MTGIAFSNDTYRYGISGSNAHSSAAIRGEQAAQLKRQAYQSDTRTTASKTVGASGIISASQTYASAIRESRVKSNETSNAIKKLRYNFKDVSSQILRSKTSRSAKMAASKAHREVLRLKRAKAGGQYDPEEVEAALEHAKAMERVAKKKAAHLEQEELIHITDEPGVNRIAEELKEHPEELAGDDKDVLDELTDTGAEPDGSLKQTAADVMSADFKAQMQAMQEEFELQREYMSEEMSRQISESMDEMMQAMSDMMSELTDQMNEMLEDMDLMVEMSAVPKEMNEADFKMLVTKHRTDEMKEMAEADKEYLKFIFEKYAKMKAGAMSAGSSAMAGISSPPMPNTAFTGSIDIAVPDMSVPAGGFDVSV